MINNSKTKIENVLRMETCPCCHSREMSKIGDIQYRTEVYYSDLVIVPSLPPELWKCNDCGSWFTQNRVLEHDSIDLYSRGSAWISPCFKSSKTCEVVNKLDSLIGNESTILDIGCSNGSLLDFAKNRGAKTFGLEYSRENRAVIESNGHKAYGSWKEVTQKFDIITAFDVVEHLYDINYFIHLCNDHLSENGILVIMTGNISSTSSTKAQNSWWYVRFPEHILFPSLKYFSSLPEFEVLSTSYTYPFRLSRSPIIFIKVLISSTLIRRHSFMPSQITPPDHMLIILKKRRLAQ